MEMFAQSEKNQSNWSITRCEDWKIISAKKRWLPGECMVVNQPETERSLFFLRSSLVLNCFLEMAHCLIQQSSRQQKTGKVLKISHFFLLNWDLEPEEMQLELSICQHNDVFVRAKGLAMVKNRLAACIGEMEIALESVDALQNT